MALEFGYFLSNISYVKAVLKLSLYLASIMLSATFSITSIG